ncbi:MAG TPA: Dna2/Cas4 domain-containing protein, partial [Chloroflexi bacterium]|nr:Dna2/Cas4 domain-containing protein [Chloroflexota bacterium]
MPETHLLSKTSFLRGVRYKKSLYLDRFRGDLRDPLDPAIQRRLAEGQQVNELARGLFPGGVLAREVPFDFAGALRRTHDLVQAGAQVLYEAGVLHDGVLAFVDILLRSGDTWTMVEVKSSNDVKDHYAWDVALQAYLLEQAGYPLEKAYLAHLNREYTRQGELDL